jgi:hypothetical protein
MANENTMLTPPALARRWGVAADKVLHLIHTAQIRAINLAHDPKGRPRYRIYLTEVERFEEARSTKPPIPKQQHRRRRQAPIGGKEYF